MNNNERLLLLTIFILMMQITRNISLIGYISILFLSYLLLYASYYSKGNIKLDIMSIKIKLLPFIFIISLLWIPIISAFNMGTDEYYISLTRYLVTFPMIVFLYIFKEYNLNLTNKFLKILCVFITFASLSIPFQIVFGSISFFAESSSREGFERFSSLAGSLTMLGTVGAVALIILLFSGNHLFSSKMRIIMVLLNIFGMLLTLQKSAVVNVILCFVFYIVFFNNAYNLIKKVIIIFLISILVVLACLFIDVSFFAEYIVTIVNYTFAQNSYGIVNDLLIRIIDLPMKLYYFHELNLLDFLIGIGFPSLAGVLGNPNYPMAHNNFIDLILSGGILHFVSYTLLIIRIPIIVLFKIIKKKNISYIDQIYSLIAISLLINMMIGAVTFYQPIYAIVIFYVVFSYDHINKEFNNINLNKR